MENSKIKSIRPKSNPAMVYLLLGTYKKEHVYILPDGRLCSSNEDYFDSPTELSNENIGLTKEQLDNSKLNQLPLNFINFLVGLQNKVKAIPNFHRLLVNPMESELQEKPRVLGGKSKIWLQSTITLENHDYHLEVLRSCHVNSLRDFMEGVFSGVKPQIHQITKNKKQLGLVNNHDIDKNLHIYLEKIGQP